MRLLWRLHAATAFAILVSGPIVADERSEAIARIDALTDREVVGAIITIVSNHAVECRVYFSQEMMDGFELEAKMAILNQFNIPKHLHAEMRVYMDEAYEYRDPADSEAMAMELFFSHFEVLERRDDGTLIQLQVRDCSHLGS